MATIETEALVLRTYNFGEADKIVVVLTQSAGVVRGVANGCRKLKSRFGAALEPFTLIKLTWYERRIGNSSRFVRPRLLRRILIF